MIECHLVSAKDQSRLHQFGKKVLPGIFLGYVLHAEGTWKGDIMVADMQELEILEASEIHAPRLNATEVIMPRWNSQVVWKRSGLPKIHFNSGPPCTREHNDVPQGQSDGSQPLDKLTNDNEARNDFWSIEGKHICLHLFEPGVQLLCGKKNHSYVGVVMRTKTSLDFLLESRIDAYWNVDSDPDLYRNHGRVPRRSQN